MTFFVPNLTGRLRVDYWFMPDVLAGELMSNG